MVYQMCFPKIQGSVEQENFIGSVIILIKSFQNGTVNERKM